MKSEFFRLIFLLGVLFSACSGRPNPAPEGTPGDQGEYLENKGSDTLVNLALAWAERYQQINPEVSISVTGGGSGTGIAALINGTVDIANASRAISAEEKALAEANGIEPVEFIVARDAIAVIVNPTNPIERLSLEQISDVYTGKIDNWRELGWEDRPIVRLSRETNSGTHVYFLEEVIRLGQEGNQALFTPETLLLPSSEGITAEIRDNPNAIGYDGLGYVTPEVKMIAVSSLGDDEYVLPSADTVNQGTYPIARDLYMYTAGAPDARESAYLDWILSPEAQQIVVDLGFVPVVEAQAFAGLPTPKISLFRSPDSH
jgi:phosphate transport system substrate-binding protein